MQQPIIYSLSIDPKTADELVIQSMYQLEKFVYNNKIIVGERFIDLDNELSLYPERSASKLKRLCVPNEKYITHKISNMKVDFCPKRSITIYGNVELLDDSINVNDITFIPRIVSIGEESPIVITFDII